MSQINSFIIAKGVSIVKQNARLYSGLLRVKMKEYKEKIGKPRCFCIDMP